MIIADNAFKRHALTYTVDVDIMVAANSGTLYENTTAGNSS